MICGSEKWCRAIKKKRENICLADNIPRLQAMIDGVILATHIKIKLISVKSWSF